MARGSHRGQTERVWTEQRVSKYMNGRIPRLEGNRAKGGAKRRFMDVGKDGMRFVGVRAEDVEEVWKEADWL